MANIQVTQIRFDVDGVSYVAQPPTEAEVAEAKAYFATIGRVQDGCQCGEEFCIGGRVWRCMAGGGGSCTWYPTNQICD